jgi:HPt (histidine-containing phosphotransfer) domain-containing protein
LLETARSRPGRINARPAPVNPGQTVGQARALKDALKVPSRLALSPPIRTVQPPAHTIEVVTDSTPPSLDDLRAELDETFRDELHERLARMTHALAQLDRAADPDARAATLDQLARDAHSVKGGAMLVGRQHIARLAAALEARFDAGEKAGQVGPPREIEAALEAMRRLAGETPPDDAEIDELAARLEVRAQDGRRDRPAGSESTNS